jgi:hypothetical protein
VLSSLLLTFAPHSYLETYTMVREIGGIGKGNGPFIAFHDGFSGSPARTVSSGGWTDFLPGMDRVALDTHPYLCFSEPNNDGLSYQAAKVRLRVVVGKSERKADASVSSSHSPARTGLAI